MNKWMRVVILVAIGSISSLAAPASAEVVFGRNVYVGGHDFSNQRFDRHHRALIYLYDHDPRNAGCHWRPDGRGGRVKVCHLRRLYRH